MYRLSCLGSVILDTESRTAAAAEAKATAAIRGHSVIVTVLQTGVLPFHMIYFPDGSMIMAGYEGDESLYHGNKHLLKSRINALRKRADHLRDHIIRIGDQLPCCTSLPCRDCCCNRVCDSWSRALHKKANLELEIQDLYDMLHAMLDARKAVRA